MTGELLVEIDRLKRTIRLLMIGLLCVGALALVAATQSGPPQDVTVRSLTVVDEQGVRRAVLAAPVPAPTSGGARAGVSSGLILYGPEGEERGGYITTAGSEGVLTLDDQNGREVFKVVANPHSGASLFLLNQNGAAAALTTYRGDPELHLRNSERVRIYSVPEDASLLPGWKAAAER